MKIPESIFPTTDSIRTLPKETSVSSKPYGIANLSSPIGAAAIKKIINASKSNIFFKNNNNSTIL